MNRVVNVGRMQLINKWTFIGIPLVIMGGAVVLIFLIGLIIPGDEPLATGVGQAPLWYFLAAGVQALTLTFPFSQGLSITRRTFFVGTVGTFSLLALVMAVLYFLLALGEEATNGWGGGARAFALPWVTDGPWYQTILFFWMVTILFFILGFWGATIYKRWSTTGLLIVSLSVAAVLVGLVALATFTSSWPLVGNFLVGQTPLSISGLLAILVILLAGGSFLTLRRALP